MERTDCFFFMPSRNKTGLLNILQKIIKSMFTPQGLKPISLCSLSIYIYIYLSPCSPVGEAVGDAEPSPGLQLCEHDDHLPGDS